MLIVRMITDRGREVVDVACSKTLFQHLSGESEENQEERRDCRSVGGKLDASFLTSPPSFPSPC
jgi:hypothetical protein